MSWTLLVSKDEINSKQWRQRDELFCCTPFNTHHHIISVELMTTRSNFSIEKRSERGIEMKISRKTQMRTDKYEIKHENKRQNKLKLKMKMIVLVIQK